MNKLKVLMFGWEYAPIVSGGLGVVCRSIAQNLIKQNVKLTFVLPRLPSKISVDNMTLINANETHYQVQADKIIEIETQISPYMSKREFEEIKNSLRLKREAADSNDMYGVDLFEEVIKYAARATEIAANNPHDVIHAHDWMTAQAAINARSVSNKPFILHIHSTEIERTAGSPHPIIFNYEKDGMLKADKIIAVSERTKDIIADSYGIDRKKIEVVHNSVDDCSTNLDSYTIPEDVSPTVLFLARLAPSKGADYLLRAGQKVIQAMPDVKFIFIGKGSMKDELVELSRELGIKDNVIFPGFLNHEQVDMAYKRASLFVMPSISEPFGITALEAIRNGTPVLMSKQSGAGEVVRNVLKVDFWDTDEMANKILAVIKHKTLASELRKNSINELQRLNWEQQTEKIIQIYHTL